MSYTARIRGEKKHEISGLFALLLFGVFAVCILSVLLTGADVYHKLTERDRDTYDRRTCTQYIATKVRQAPSGALVGVDDKSGVQSVILYEEIDEIMFETRIYCYDGWLCELFTWSGREFYPQDGEKILEANDMSASIVDGILKVDITNKAGESSHIELYLRGDGEVSAE